MGESLTKTTTHALVETESVDDANPPFHKQLQLSLDTRMSLQTMLFNFKPPSPLDLSLSLSKLTNLLGNHTEVVSWILNLAEPTWIMVFLLSDTTPQKDT